MGKSIVEKLLITGTKYPPEEELEHFNNCEGCSRCDYMLEFFGQCHCCAIVIDKMEMYYDHPGGDYYCEDCIGAMPDDNTNDYVLCGHCCKRDIRENMEKYHENFQNTWTCNKCVGESIINNRFEIMDL
jgi:hypothetical protein